MSPPVGVRKPAMMLSKVDLPHPLGPTMQRNSEASMAKVAPSTPRTRPAGVSYASETSRTSMWGIRSCCRLFHASAHDPHPFVMAGLVPAIPLRDAGPRPPEGDHRAKPGDDEERGFDGG